MTYYKVEVWKINCKTDDGCSYDVYEINKEFLDKDDAKHFIKHDLFRLKKYAKYEDLDPDEIHIIKYERYMSDYYDLNDDKNTPSWLTKSWRNEMKKCIEGRKNEETI